MDRMGGREVIRQVGDSGHESLLRVRHEFDFSTWKEYVGEKEVFNLMYNKGRKMSICG